eukprot:SAG11_NODE_25274_length_361_cov_0.740458_1_plen_38_part_10
MAAEESGPEDGMPLFIGDYITLENTTDQGFVVADGFNT